LNPAAARLPSQGIVQAVDRQPLPKARSHPRGAAPPALELAGLLRRVEAARAWARASSREWTVSLALGSGVLVLVGALLLVDGNLDALTRLITDAPTTHASAGPTFVSAEPHAPTDVAPPLPPRPDLAPPPIEPGGGGAGAAGGGRRGAPPRSVPGKTLEDVCVDPVGATSGCRRWAMDGLYSALAAAETGTRGRPARVLFYGDSVSATDALPGRLRARLQDVFGDGGPGFLHAVKPHRYNHTEAADRRSSGSWRSWGVSLSHISDHLYGIGNATAEGNGAIRIKPLTPSGNLSRVDLYYLAQPGGGTAELSVGEVSRTIDTAATAKTARFERLVVPDGAYTVDVAARGKVRLFGMALERDSGIVVDNLALVSCTAKNMLVNLAEHWRNQLAHREPDLIVIMLGTNEAQWLVGPTAMAEYEQTWNQLLAPVRAARPQAACLVMSPLDQAESVDGELRARRGVPRMVAAQRRAAEAAGCAYWDTFTWMGGSGSAITWQKRGLLGSDFAHMSRRGTARVADGLADALFSGYKAYKAR
jgi:lysophospholipase L1-like esterase